MRFFLPALAFSGLVYSTAINFEAPEEVALESRSTQSILGAISTIAADVATLTKSVQAFQGDIQDALTISTQSQQLSMDIQSATSTTNDSNKLKNAGSAKVAGAVIDLEPAIFKLLKLLVKKKPQFDSVLMGTGSMLVLQSLKDQQGYTADFGKAIQSKLSKNFAALAPAEQKKINRAFNKAIAAYEQDGGIL